MSSSHKLTTTPERVKALTEALGVGLDEFFRSAREEFFGNFFITKAIMPPEKEVREYARQGLFLQKQSVLKYPATDTPDFQVIVYSPPIESLDDFFSATILLSPGKSIKDCLLPRPATIHLPVINGNIEIRSEHETKTLLAGQTAHFNGGVKHSIVNLSKDRTAEILISFAPTLMLAQEIKDSPSTTSTENLNISRLVKQTQSWLSPAPEISLPIREVALFAGFKTRDLALLSQTKLSNYPLEKMERLAELLKVPIEKLFKGDPFNQRLNIEITSASEHGAYDYRARHGMTFYPWIKLGAEKKELFIGQATFDAQFLQQTAIGNEPREKIWKGLNRGYLLAKGLNGKLGVHAGERHNYTNIDREDTVYLDMSLGFSVRNFSAAEPANFFLVSNASLF